MNIGQRAVLVGGFALTALLVPPPAAAASCTAPSGSQACAGLWIAIGGNAVPSTSYVYAGSGATSLSYSGSETAVFGNGSLSTTLNISASMSDGAIPTLDISVSGSFDDSASAKTLRIYVLDVNSNSAYATPPAGGINTVTGMVTAAGTSNLGATVSGIVGLHNNTVHSDGTGGFNGTLGVYGGGDLDVAGSIDNTPTTGPGCTPSSSGCAATGTAFNPVINLSAGGVENASGDFRLRAVPNTLVEEIDIAIDGSASTGTGRNRVTTDNTGSFDIDAGANVPEPFSVFLLGTAAALLASRARKFRKA